jgi:hypothetical protein
MKHLIILFLIMLLGVGTSYAAPPEADHPGDEFTLSVDQSIDDVSFTTVVTGVASVPIRAVNSETDMIYAIDPVLFDALQQSENYIRKPDPISCAKNPPVIYTAGLSFPDDINWASILNVALFIASVTFGGSLVIFRKKGREVANALHTIMDAVEDNNISQKEEKEIVASIRKIFSK